MQGRIFVDADGAVQLDRLQLDSPVAAARSRPLLGDLFELSLLGGRFDKTWLWTDLGPAQLHLYSPVSLTPLGFSNTDADPDSKFKVFVGLGAGPGVHLATRVAGPWGLSVRAEGMGHSLHRFRVGADQVRHELSGHGELGLGWFGPRSSVVVAGWAELISQFETRDAGGRHGADRRYSAGGVRLIALSSVSRPETLDPDRVDALQDRMDEDGSLDVDEL